jgi:Ca2+-binding EF-hand superfamily protein
MKLDLASSDDLENIREKFNKMDVDQSGKLDVRELNVELAFSKADVDGSGEIDFPEFIKLLVHLCVVCIAFDLVAVSCARYS